MLAGLPQALVATLFLVLVYKPKIMWSIHILHAKTLAIYIYMIECCFCILECDYTVRYHFILVYSPQAFEATNFFADHNLFLQTSNLTILIHSLYVESEDYFPLPHVMLITS